MTVANVSEATFQSQVTELARITGWRVNHIRRSIGKGRRWTTSTSVVGWPDCCFWHPGRGQFFMAELKTQKGVVSAAQRDVINSLRAAGVDVRIWRPTDWDEIQATLNRRSNPNGRTRA